TDIVDPQKKIDTIMKNTIDKFKELFPNPSDINQNGTALENFNQYLNNIQKELHSKIAIIGPAYSGKTTLYNMLRTGEEKPHMDFAKTSTLEIDGIPFDLWDFQLNDNFSLLWSKFVGGSDLLILFFNLANYNLKMINFFLNLHKNESNYSKLLVIGNKRDLVEDIDLKRIRNELSIPEFKEVSLNNPDAKSEIKGYISEILGLKEEFPENFERFIKEADDLVLEGKKIQALAKYKEISALSESYQNIMFTKNLKQKIDDLNNKIKQDLDKRREFERTKEFKVAKPLLFTRKVTVKPLPTSESLGKPQDQEPLEEELTPVRERAPQKLVSFQPLEKEQEIKPAKVIKPQLKAIKKIPPPKEIRKGTSPPKTTDFSAPKAKMPLELFGDHENIKKDMEKPLIIDFTKQLQKLITEKGSSLSLQWCENLLSELQKTLGRPLTIEDVKSAADFFVKQDKLS
ncbi:MAG: ADP-ribosylation factor-like protein, partial [Candidatus Lokiarchaeia archaeon]|nr:ADP-ribosylation factor-like protein [Candidatus Lokiarchaeia archaeon]